MVRVTSRPMQRATDALTTTIRDHPVPAAMIAVGIGWMVWSLRAERNRYRRWSNTPSRVADRLRETADYVRERTQQMADAAATTARDAARRGADVAARSYDRHPLTMGAVAMTAGVAAGMAVPMTDPELRWMGSARDEMADRIQRVASATRERMERARTRMSEEAEDLATAMEAPHQAT